MDIFKKLRGKFRAEKVDEPRTAIEKLTAIFGFINSLAYIVGIEFKNDWHMTNRSVLTVFLNSCIIWCETYTTVLQFPALDCVILFGGFAFTTNICTKYAVIMCNHKKFMSSKNFIFKLYNENVSGNRELILSATTDAIKRHLKYTFAGLFFGFSGYSFYPFYDMFFNKNLTPVSPLMMPAFIDTDVLKGYLISLFVNLWPIVWNGVGNCAVISLFLVYVDVYAGLVSLIEEDFRIFDSMWEIQDQNIIAKRKLAFRNIMLELMDIARFNKYMNELFSIVATVQIVCSWVGIATLLFGYLAINYISGIGGAVYFTTELMVFCFIGQLLQNTSQRILLVIFNSKWYTYGTNYQKDLVFALNIIQNAKPILIAYVYPLNFRTGLKVINNVYSILMFLLNVQE